MNALRIQFRRHILVPNRTALKTAPLLTVITTISTGTVTFCAAGGGEGNNQDDDFFSKIQNIAGSDLNIDAIGRYLGSNVQDVIDSGVPTQISYGFLCGYSSGFALKKVGKAASSVFGLGFVALQSLAYAGYIEINHDALQKNVENALDLNNDGKVDGGDANVAYDKLMEVLQFNMTGGSGFAAGFLGGFRSG